MEESDVVLSVSHGLLIYVYAMVCHVATVGGREEGAWMTAPEQAMATVIRKWWHHANLGATNYQEFNVVVALGA